MVSAPSGAGKTTICKSVLRDLDKIAYSVSYTTRPCRRGEVEGKDYYFVSRDRFEEMIRQGQFLEWANVYGNLYGTARSEVLSRLEKGVDVLLDIDVQGASQVRRHFPQAVTVFVLPPSLKILEKRLSARGTDDPEVLRKRLEHASSEIEAAHRYQYIIVNNVLDDAVSDLKAIIRSRRLRSQRVLSRVELASFMK